MIVMVSGESPSWRSYRPQSALGAVDKAVTASNENAIAQKPTCRDRRGSAGADAPIRGAVRVWRGSIAVAPLRIAEESKTALRPSASRPGDALVGARVRAVAAWLSRCYAAATAWAR